MKKLRSKYCTTSELADYLGRSIRRVQQMIRDGQIPPPNNQGHLNTWAVLNSYIHSLQEALTNGGGESESITSARSRYEKARAEEKELEVAKLKGAVVLAEDVRDEWQNMVSNFRARMLTLPTTIGLQGEGMTRTELIELAEKLVHKSLKELSEGEFDELIVAADTEQTEVKANNKGSVRKRKATTKVDGE